MDRKFELGVSNLREAVKKAAPLFKDWRSFQPDVNVMDELLLGVADAFSRGTGSAEEKVRVAADVLLEHLPGWIKQTGDDENTVEIRKELGRVTADSLHMRAVSCARLCTDELMGMTHDARHQTAQRLASAWGWASRVTAHVLERSGNSDQ